MTTPIVTNTVQGIEIYAFRYDLGQADMPYNATVAGRPPSDKDFTLCADTITITGPLINPGKNLTLIAREIILKAPVILDVSGANPTATFAPGDLPTQTDTSFGATGTAGTSGTTSLPAGRLTICAETISTGSTAGHPGSLMTLQDWATNVVGTVAAGARQQLATHDFTGLHLPITIGFIDGIDLSGTTLHGLDQWKSLKPHWINDGGGLRISVDFTQLDVRGSMSFLSTSLTITSDSFTATGALALAGSAGQFQVQSAEGKVDQTTVNVTLQNMATAAAATAPIGSAIADALRTNLGPVLTQALPTARSSVALGLLAQGGDGARGQDGHPGLPGESGDPGVQTSTHGLISNGIPIAIPSEAVGGDGKPGGQGGSAGQSTDGAAGGSVDLSLVTPCDGTILVGIGGGVGGLRASPGAPGAGGAAGQGAQVVFDDGDNPGTVIFDFAPNGKDGAAGAVATFAGQAGADGADGSAQLNGKPFAAGTFAGAPYDAVAARYPLTLLLLTDQQATLNYLNARTGQEFADVGRLYGWIMNITEPFARATPVASTLDPDDIAVRVRLHANADLELQRMGQGLDYYGHAYNWVPVLSMKALQTRIQTVLAIGATVETTYNSFQDQTASLAQRLNALDSTVTHLQQVIADDQKQVTDLQTAADQAYNDVLTSLTSVENQKNQLVAAQYAFKQQFIDYVIGQQTQCTFKDVLNAVATIVTFGATVVTGIGEVQAVAEAEDIFKAADKIVKVIKAAKEVFASIESAYNAIAASLAKEPDAGKIVLEEDKFAKFIDQYLGKFPAADELNDAVKLYLGLVQAHNKAALGYTALCVRRMRLETQIALRQSMVQRIASERAAQKATAIPAEYVTFMESAYQQVKNTLLLELYEFNRAYEYWSLLPRAFSVAASDIAGLGSTYLNWSTDIDTYLQQTGPFQPFSEEITISSTDFPAAFALLPQSKALSFPLRLESFYAKSFQNMTHITASSVTIELPDITATTGVAFMTLIHSGDSILNSDPDLSKPGAVQAFTHSPRSIPYKIDYAAPSNSAGGLIGDDAQGFPGLSPFTLWTLDFGLQGNGWIDLTKIKSVKLTFSGSFLL